ncbi:tyrosine aminotransferase [Rhodotorula diobovata]|uniref:Tyrosine aminotransferase n=1 Tax=Rhodotorula diobovata TaxID=5288 RepID=A0A5C5FMC2_9BASI|nr:tyrosine aminotransferase [Rhodotorula diobovata]
MSPQALHDGATPKPWKPVPVSSGVNRISNPIREIIANIDLSAPPEAGVPKQLINLGLGDPSVFGNLPPAPESIAAIEASLKSGRALGYPESVGYPDAREAVANYFDEGSNGTWRVTKNDVIMTHGASGALEMAISVLADSTKNVLFPKPLFTAYETMSAIASCEIRYYDLLPEQNWEVDLAHLESLLDENTAFVMLNNPSNPCGSNWSEQHLRDIAAVMAKHQTLVITDEVYAGLAWDVTGPTPAAATQPRVEGKFNRGVFTPYASICGPAPCLVIGAVSKRWLAPGWRLGWVIVHDPLGVLAEVRGGLAKWAFRIQGPNSTMQRALPAILANTPERFYLETMDELKRVGEALFDRLERIPGLTPRKPQGAMYLICQYSGLDFKDDKAFVTALHEEERVFILPGAAFRLDGYIRFVTTTPLPILLEACERIEAFVKRHAKTA